MRVDQLVPAFHWGDAIGDTAFHMKRFFLSQGFQSEIYCLTRDRGLEEESKIFSSFPKPSPSDVTILHFALPSPLTHAFAGLPSRKTMIYHNLTPHGFFKDFSQEMVRISQIGREELVSLAPKVALALADSEFNRQELLKIGFKKAEVFPLFVDFKKYKKPMNRLMYNLFKDDRTNVLFVGRVVPNKRIDDLIKVIFYYKKYISPLIRLIIVGKIASLPKYYKSLVTLADEFYLKPEEICFTGHISDEEMFAIYKASDLFLSLSEHEGFGLPFIESMIFDLPIIAYDCTAVPYTLGGAGVLIKNKRKDYVGELVNIVANDMKLREGIIEGQRRRLKKFKEMERE
ncbi:MAG: glycosyltransferase family 4 protein, partial [Candidatus Aminicenantes bacterium]|nr:glycosyltransferase family 4 protein [Candidatus Aminicenantes bacterium]